MAKEGGLLEVEGGPEVLDGGDGYLVGGINGDTLAETREDVMQLLVGVAGLWEHGAKQLPCLSHTQHLHTHTHTHTHKEKGEGRKEKVQCSYIHVYSAISFYQSCT